MSALKRNLSNDIFLVRQWKLPNMPRSQKIYACHRGHADRLDADPTPAVWILPDMLTRSTQSLQDTTHKQGHLGSRKRVRPAVAPANDTKYK